jgi:hypothetical protein
MKVVGFKPRWLREQTEEDRRLDAEPMVGAIPQGPPRINTRLVLPSGVYSVSFKTLSEAIELTQTILQYASCDVLYGLNPDFADLRSVGREAAELAKLTADPFEEGSFIIPARLESDEVEAQVPGQRRKVTTQDVADRFQAMLGAFYDAAAISTVSIGAVQAIESLGRVIRREASAVEYAMLDNIGRPAPPILVTEEVINRVAKVRQTRRSSRAELETLDGTITALDIVQATLQLNLADSGQRVKGTFSPLFQPTLVERLGRRVQLQGQVERRGRRILSIRVESVAVADEES